VAYATAGGSSSKRPPLWRADWCKNAMTEQSTNPDWLQWNKPLTHSYECRHEIVQELAYQHWEKRGRPVGSPEVDWFAAEEALRSFLLASGAELAPGGNLYR